MNKITLPSVKYTIFSTQTSSYLLKHSTCARVLPGFPGVEKHRLEIISILTYHFSNQVHFFNHFKRLLDSNILQTNSVAFTYQSHSD